MKRLVWGAEALDDLDRVALYIGADSPKAALRVFEYIRSIARNLEMFPQMGRASADPRFRELILARYPYLLVYEIVGDEVRILAVYHHKQSRL